MNLLNRRKNISFDRNVKVSNSSHIRVIARNEKWIIEGNFMEGNLEYPTSRSIHIERDLKIILDHPSVFIEGIVHIVFITRDDGLKGISIYEGRNKNDNILIERL